MYLDHCAHAGGVSFCLCRNLGGWFASTLEQLYLGADSSGRFEFLGAFHHLPAPHKKNNG